MLYKGRVQSQFYEMSAMVTNCEPIHLNASVDLCEKFVKRQNFDVSPKMGACG